VADLSESQQKRARARERRRRQSDDSGSGNGADNAPGNDELAPDGSALGKAAKGAVAAAAVGAAAAAARALASHDDDEQPEPQEQAEPEDEEPLAEAPEPEPEREPDPQPEREEQREPVAGAAPTDARRVLDSGREQLEDLLGRPVESVSSLERTHDGWVLALEVVEVRRVPETMDVLASYEMELDDELNLRRYQQARRYNRSRAGEDL